MPSKNLHEEPFDDCTITKLEIFEDYAQAWIPTFVMQKVPTICIFDFFAGTGYDLKKIPGSPIRILKKIGDHIGHIYANGVQIKLYLNEYEPNKSKQQKFIKLKSACEEFLSDNKSVRGKVDIFYYNEDFEDLFPKLLPEIKQNPSLVYIDQNGIKFLSDKYLLELEKMSQTDFLYFASSSYIWRLGDTEEFKRHLAVDIERLKSKPFKLIHRGLISELKEKLPSNTKLKLYPFSIKKGKNIFGIIFGATHPRAVDKFLDIAWKRNETNGQANFDMDEDSGKSQLDIFGGKKLTKIESFKETLKSKILRKEISNNFEALTFVHEEGHIGKHAADLLREMKKRGEITYTNNSPLVNYEKVYRKKIKLTYNVLSK